MEFENWYRYFERNKSHFSHINWEKDDPLLPVDKKLLAPSLQQFQRGEHSEGKHLFAYAESLGEPAYTQCIRLFIREEQTHARVLGKYLKKHGIPIIRKHWVDGIFRQLRKISGLQNTLTVLLTAEIIANVYYKALWTAHFSPVLDEICRQILLDEDRHIEFQCTTLHHIYKTNNFFQKFIHRNWHLLLMTCTIGVVWVTHRKLLRRCGYRAARFFLENLLVFSEARIAVIQGENIPQWAVG